MSPALSPLGPGHARLLASLHNKLPPLALQVALIANTPLTAAFVPSPFARRRQALVQRPVGRRRGSLGRAGAAAGGARPAGLIRRGPDGGGDAPPLPMLVDAAGVVTDAAVAGEGCEEPWQGSTTP